MQPKWSLISLLPLLFLSDHINGCPFGFFNCGDGECISRFWQCDGVIDCANQADEMNCNANNSNVPKECSRTDCKHGCRLTTSYDDQCYCRDGFYLGEDNKTCHDIDECSIPGWCSQMCVNSIGSFECSCKEGYDLQANSRTCMVPPDVEPLLLYADLDSIRGIYLQDTGNGTRHNFARPFKREALGIATFSVNLKTSKIFWADTRKHLAPVIYSSNITGEASKEPVVRFGLLDPRGFDNDWVADNVYIGDMMLGKIIVCKADGSVCSVLLTNRVDPYDLTLDPANGYMYWLEFSTPSSSHFNIYRAGMDGSEVIEIAHDVWVGGLTIDPPTSRLYWMDWYTATLEYYDPKSGKHGEIMNSSVPRGNSLTVFEDNFFWAYNGGHSISTCVTFYCHNETDLFSEDGETIKKLFVHHPSLYDKSIANPCETEPCSHLCLLAPGNSYKCACPYHMILAEDQKTCTAMNATFILVSQKYTIQKIYPYSIGRYAAEEVRLPQNFTITDFSFDPDSNMLYIFECEDECSIIECDLTRQLWELIAQLPGRSVRGLIFDRRAKNLLWVDYVLGHLEVFSIKTRTQRTLIDKGLVRPVDLAINYRDRVVYIANLGPEPFILQANLDGTQQRKLISGSQVGLPVSVVYSADLQRLYWADAKLHKLKQIDLSDDAMTKSSEPVIVFEYDRDIMSIGLVNKTFIYTDKRTPYLYAHEPLNSTISFPLPPQREKSLKKIQVIEMNVDNIRCKEDESPCLDGVNCYNKLLGCDGRRDCSDGSDELNCNIAL